MYTFSELKKKLKQDFSQLEPVRVSLLGDTATPLLAQAIRATGFDRGFDLQIWEAEFNQIERQVFDAASELYAGNPQVIIIFHSTHKLLLHYNKLSPDEHAGLAAERLELIGRLCGAIGARSSAKVIYYNYPEIDDGVFGQFANKVESSFLFQLRKLNYRLMEYASGQANLYICDLAAFQGRLGKPQIFSPALYVNADMVLALDSLPAVADGTVALVAAFFGTVRKCLVLDLDNTLWGGVIGDDGLENLHLGALGIGKAFTEFQYWLKKLKDRGIILAVCSKNTEAVVMEAFARHPDMVLSAEDIAVFRVNWENKVDNIRQIRAVLNIGFDSMVFLDDNPFERNMVRDGIPEITVPELPDDPAEYLEYLYTLDLFEASSFSGEDRERTKLYQTEARREAEMQKYDNEEAFLESLEMVSVVEAFNKFNTPRVAQLTQRSNQFNLRTVRYTEGDIMRLGGEEGVFTFCFGLRDKYGDNGIICVVILKKEGKETLFIDTWVMSCRVLKRGMEQFTLNTLVDFGRSSGFRYLRGEYLPTVKNAMVREHYERLGFQWDGRYWVLDLQTYRNKNTYINLQ